MEIDGRCCVTSLGLPIWSHHTIGSLWLSTGLGGVGGQAVSQDWLPEALSWGQMKSPRLLRSTTYQLLPLRLPGLPSFLQKGCRAGHPGQAR